MKSRVALCLVFLGLLGSVVSARADDEVSRRRTEVWTSKVAGLEESMHEVRDKLNRSEWFYWEATPENRAELLLVVVLDLSSRLEKDPGFWVISNDSKHFACMLTLDSTGKNCPAILDGDDTQSYLRRNGLLSNVTYDDVRLNFNEVSAAAMLSLKRDRATLFFQPSLADLPPQY